MKEYWQACAESPLFQGIQQEEMEAMLGCMGAKARGYRRGEYIFLAGNPANRVGVLLAGEASVLREDVLGNRSILAKLSPGEAFGEVFACAGVQVLPVSVYADSDCEALLMDYRKLLTSCGSACAFHARLVQNMLRLLAGKTLQMNQKMEVLSARSIREKLMAYLLQAAGRAGGVSFRIPYNRQELADYLAVDRSALSRELGLMQREGLLRYQKDAFTLLQDGARGANMV